MGPTGPKKVWLCMLRLKDCRMQDAVFLSQDRGRLRSKGKCMQDSSFEFGGGLACQKFHHRVCMATPSQQPVLSMSVRMHALRALEKHTCAHKPAFRYNWPNSGGGGVNAIGDGGHQRVLPVAARVWVRRQVEAPACSPPGLCCQLCLTLRRAPVLAALQGFEIFLAFVRPCNLHGTAAQAASPAWWQ